jgi:hypothetical protein
VPPFIAAYRPRNLQDSAYYRWVENHFETFIQIFDDHFFRQAPPRRIRSAIIGTVSRILRPVFR